MKDVLVTPDKFTKWICNNCPAAVKNPCVLFFDEGDTPINCPWNHVSNWQQITYGESND